MADGELCVPSDDARLQLIGRGGKAASTALAAPGQCRSLEIRRVGKYPNPPLEGRPLKVGRSIPTHPTDSLSRRDRRDKWQ